MRLPLQVELTETLAQTEGVKETEVEGERLADRVKVGQDVPDNERLLQPVAVVEALVQCVAVTEALKQSDGDTVVEKEIVPELLPLPEPENEAAADGETLLDWVCDVV